MSLSDYSSDYARYYKPPDPNEEPLNHEKTHLVLLGNGFDISHGLPTSYDQFMDWLEGFIVNDGEDRFIQKSKKAPRKIISRRELYQHVKSGGGFSSDNTPDIQLVHYLSSLLQSGKSDWFDIEKFYFKSLITTSHLVKARELNKFLENIQFSLSEYLNDINDTITESTWMQGYADLFKKLNGYYRDVRLINFNYTTTAQLYKESTSRIISIHGEVNSLENPVVFGYGDEFGREFQELEDRDEDEYLRFFKTNLYHFSNSLTFLQQELLKPFDLSIIGHSCGLSDRTLLRSIVTSRNCHKIHLYHHEGQKSFRETVLRLYRHFPDKQMAREKIKPYDDKLKIPQANPIKN